jgi:deazaflavin-dependent oxidoreductase (nitroreductase family)
MSAKEVEKLEKPDFLTEEAWEGIKGSVASLEVIRGNARAHTEAYLATGGGPGISDAGGVPVLLLTTIGRKSGKEITTPLNYMEDGENVVVVASLAGYDVYPHWWRNLEKNPQASVQVNDRKWAVRARKTAGEERRQLWARLMNVLPLWGVFQQRTEREFPVVTLSPEK